MAERDWLVGHEEFVERRRQALAQRDLARLELQMFTRRLVVLLLAPAALVIAGSFAFAVTEGVSVAYGFVRTRDTVTTLGSIHDPPSAAGRVVAVLLEIFGIGTLFYGLATVAEFFVTGQLSGLLAQRRTQRMIDSFTDHIIVCGSGRVGRQVSHDLRAAGVAHVAIDADPAKKLRRAGADRVISPYKISGSEMVRTALRPQVGAVQVADDRMEETEVPAACPGIGRSIGAVRGEAVGVAVRYTDGRLEHHPSPESVLEAGDMLVAIGHPDALEALEAQFQPVVAGASS